MPHYKVFKNFNYNHNSQAIEGYCEDDIKQIRLYIESHKVVILKSVFNKSLMREIKERVFNHMIVAEENNPEIEVDVPNYFRRDENPEKSAVKRIKQFFASFYWNKDIAGETELMKAMSKLRNQVAELPIDYAINGIESDGYMTYSNITHYPSGGGMLNKHQDPPNKQFTVIISSMSEKQKDFEVGGVYIEVEGEKIDLDQILEIGDVYLMNPQTIHGVEAIDPHLDELQWQSPKGRWILFPALIELKTLKGIKVEGLKDLQDANN